jgi:hypothetical protein
MIEDSSALSLNPATLSLAERSCGYRNGAHSKASCSYLVLGFIASNACCGFPRAALHTAWSSNVVQSEWKRQGCFPHHNTIATDVPGVV